MSPTDIATEAALFDERADLPVVAEENTFLAAIERAARDPSVDVDKMERLVAMAERMQAKQAEGRFNDAMNAAQAEIGRVKVDQKNKQTSSSYASYPALDRAVRPIYTKHGFALSFSTADGAPTDCVRVTCRVSHSAGHSEHYQIDMPADGKGAKGGDVMTKTHATGSAMSYGQRYLLKLIFNIAVSEDDDGNAAGNTGPFITNDQVDAVNALIDSVCADKGKLLAWLNVPALNEMPAAKFEEVMARLAQKGRGQ